MLADIFGKHVSSIYKEGLVDCTSEEAFDTMLQHLKKVWNEYETLFAPSSGLQFYAFFSRYQADVVNYHMRRDLRESAGLGSPPAIFTTNSSESINAVVKEKLNVSNTNGPTLIIN